MTYPTVIEKPAHLEPVVHDTFIDDLLVQAPRPSAAVDGRLKA